MLLFEIVSVVIYTCRALGLVRCSAIMGRSGRCLVSDMKPIIGSRVVVWLCGTKTGDIIEILMHCSPI